MKQASNWTVYHRLFWGSVMTLALVLGACNTADDTDAITATETLYERYVEHYDDQQGPVESWVYSTDGTLTEYSVFIYSDNRLSRVRTYNSSSTLNESTLISELLYEYDAAGNVIRGEVLNQVAGSLATSARFSASYNAQGQYLVYLEQDAAGAVLEHRTCSYDASGYNYQVETYYADAAATDIIESYSCSYDAVETWKWLREDHYLKLVNAAAGNDATAYERQLVYTYTWNGNDMYLQSDFDESGNRVLSIMYSYKDGLKQTRSYINDAGQVLLYRTWHYDNAGNLIELRHYNNGNAAGQELELRETFRLYTKPDNNYLMYEKCIYTLDYAYRSPLARRSSAPSHINLRKPAPAHHQFTPDPAAP